MKKYLSFLLIIALLFGLAACANAPDEDEESCEHSYKKATCTSPAVCKFCKETKGKPLGHDYADATCTSPAKCKLCKHTKGKPLDHDYTEASCTSPAACKLCGKTKGDPIEHKFIKGSDGFACKYCGNSKQELPKDKEKTIAFISKGETHAFWQAVKAGAQMAAAENGYKLTFQGPGGEDESFVSEQKGMLQTALDNNVDGIVLATIGVGFADHLTQAYDKGIPIITFDSGLYAGGADITEDKNPVVAHVGLDNKASGAISAEKLFAAIRTDIAKASADAPYVVGIIQHDQTTTGYDRAMGFEEKFKALADADEATNNKYRIWKEIKVSPTYQGYIQALAALNDRGIKALFMTSEGVVQQVYDACKDAPGEYDNIIFTGFDASTKQVTWIAEGGTPALLGSVAQDSITLGYQAVMQCIAAVEGRKVANIDIPGVWYDSKNLKEMVEMDLAYTDCTEDKEALLRSTIVSTPTHSTENPQIDTPSGVVEKGEGRTSFHFEVMDIDGKTTRFLVKTDKAIVSDALLETGLITGDPGPYGLYVKSVNGITADYSTEGAYWAFFINGEYALKGVDQTEIDPTATYAFIKTKD